jgi:hypothetical protein
MKMNLKSAALAVALAGAAAGAHASALTFQPSTGNSSLVLTVFDQSTGKSYFSEIGGAGRLDSITAGTFTLSGLAGFFTGSDPANLFWGVVAGDSTLDPGASFVFGTRALTTSLGIPNVGSVTGNFPGGGPANLQNFDQTACGAIAAGSACTANAGSDPTSAAGGSWGADWGSVGLLSGDFLSNASSLALWLITPDASQGDDFLASLVPPVAVQTAYTAALNLVTGQVTLSNGTPEVPLPAAVWLFGSALGAMGIIGRRRRAVPAALPA